MALNKTLGDFLMELDMKSPLLDGEIGLSGTREYRAELLNEGQNLFVLRTRLIVDRFYFDAVIGKGEYDMADIYPNFLCVDVQGGGVKYDGSRLEGMTIPQIERNEEDWKKVAVGTPEEYYERNGRFIGFKVPPDAEKRVEVNAIVRPLEMVTDADMPFNGHPRFIEYQKAPLYYALFELASDDKTVSRYKGQFEEMIGIAKGEIYRRPDVQASLQPQSYRTGGARRNR